MPKGLEQKSVSLLEWKREESGPGSLAGYISVKGNIDSVGDRILDGAYGNIEEFKRMGVMSFNHKAISGDQSLPLGYVEEAKEDTIGLWVKFVFHTTDAAQDARKVISERMEAGKDCEMSMAYIAEEYAFVNEGNSVIREIKRLWVKEGGFVVMAANKLAGATEVKGGTGATIAEDFDLAREQVEKVIDRIADLKESASGELSRGRVEIVKQLHEKCGELLDAIQSKAEEEEPEMATDEQVDEILSAIPLEEN